MTEEQLEHERRHDQFSRRHEDHLVRMAQAWIIPILLAVISALIYPLIAKIGETEKRVAEAERNLAVMTIEVEHVHRQLEALERRMDKANSVSLNPSRWPNADLMKDLNFSPERASAAKL
jgi:hypothetical protein